ncbi:MAG: CYTH domain-containing protein [Magnetococcales bacterium]|nr:CYTH domain-containing protein [Magnetococcales bacterium]
MGIEIERRFLVKDDRGRSGATVIRLKQGLLSTDKERVVRVRLVGETGTLTIKGPTRGTVKSEFEYPIPPREALELLDTLCLRPLIEKQRYHLIHDTSEWVVDEFEGENQGLVLAEIELDRADQPFAIPPWLGIEVSDDPRYFNSNLATHPYCQWERK